MKQKFSVQLASLAFISIIVFFGLLSYAQQRTYECHEIDGVPTTIAQTSRGPLWIIRWVSDDLPQPPTQIQRCRNVSDKLQMHRDNHTLKYIATRTMNGKTVVCVAEIRNGPCTDILFELRPGSDPKYVLRQILNQRGLGARNPLNQGGEEIYINIDDYLDRVTVE